MVLRAHKKLDNGNWKKVEIGKLTAQKMRKNLIPEEVKRNLEKVSRNL